MNRRTRIRRFNEQTQTYDTIFPQTVTENILRRDDGGVLESYLQVYDKHVRFPSVHFNRTFSSGGHRHLIANIPHKKLVDHFPLLLDLHTELDFEPTLDFNRSGPKPIINGAGERVPGGQVPGAIIFLVFSAKMDAWIMLSNDNYNDLTRVMTPVEHQWYYVAQGGGESTFVIPGFNRQTMRIREVNYGQTVLVYGVDYDFDYSRKDTIQLKRFKLEENDVLYFIWNSYVTTARKSNTKFDIQNTMHNIEIKEDNTNYVTLPENIDNAMAYSVIYGQTKLREGIDFLKEGYDGQLRMAFPLMKGDWLNVETTDLVEAAGEVLPNNWGSTGHYRYSVETIHGEYKATDDNITVIPVPEFNRRRDKIFVTRGNHVMVWDVDYTVDLLDQVVLLTDHLDKGEMIYWTILRGAMVDVPNFNVIRASGVSGQHLLVDISWSQICDYFVLLIKLTRDLETAPTIKCIDGPARPVADCFGDPVRGGYKEGSFLWVVYNEDKKTWYSLGHGQMDLKNLYPTIKVVEGDDNFHGNEPDDHYYGDDGHHMERAIPHGLGMAPTAIDINPIEPPGKRPSGMDKVIGDVWYYADDTYIYVGNTGDATSKFHWRATNSMASLDLKAYFDEQLSKLKAMTPNLTTRLEAFTVENDDATFIPVDWFSWKDDIILVNYGQTILRENLDFRRSETGIHMTNFVFMKNDIVQYELIKQDPEE